MEMYQFIIKCVNSCRKLMNNNSNLCLLQRQLLKRIVNLFIKLNELD